MGRDWETEKERTRGERETRRFREMERDKKTHREMLRHLRTEGHRHLGRNNKKGGTRDSEKRKKVR